MNAHEWLKPWMELAPGQAEALEAQLRRELQRGHVLYGVAAKAIGIRIDCDDVLYELPNHPVYRLAVVHLTYSTNISPQWPQTAFYRDWPQWEHECMLPNSRGDEE